MRENTERPESVAVGTTTSLPIQHDRIIGEIERRLASASAAAVTFAVEIAVMADGRSGERCAEQIAALSRSIEAERGGAGQLNAAMLADERLESIAGDARVAAARLPPTGCCMGLHRYPTADTAAAWPRRISTRRRHVYAEITGYFLHWRLPT